MKKHFRHAKRFISGNTNHIRTLLRTYPWVTTVIAGLFVLGFISAFSLPNEIKLAQLSEILDQYSKVGKESRPEFLSIFLNNVQASGLPFLLGFLLIVPLLSAFFVGFTGGIFIDLFYRASVVSGQNMLLPTIIGMIPHGVIEIPTVLLSAGLSLFWGIKLYSRDTFLPKLSKKKFLLKTLGAYIFVCIPLLFIASVIESSITPFFILATLPPQKKESPVAAECRMEANDMSEFNARKLDADDASTSGFQATQTLAIAMYDDQTFTELKENKPLYSSSDKFELSDHGIVTANIFEYHVGNDALRGKNMYERILEVTKKQNPEASLKKVNNIYILKSHGKTTLEYINNENRYVYVLQYSRNNVHTFRRIIATQQNKIDLCATSLY